jgi:ABC-2 type transport system permease protein
MNAVRVLWLREVKKYLRSRTQIVSSLGQPLLYMLVLGFGLGPVFAQAGAGNYLQFLAPGLVGMAVLFSAAFSGIGLLWDRQFGFLRVTLAAPVPRFQVMLGRTLGGATVAVIQGVLVLVACVIVGFRPASLVGLLSTFGLMLLIAVVFCAMGTALGSKLENMQAFTLVMNFILMPLFFLSGALYPLTNLPLPLKLATSLDPLTYGVDALRAALLGLAHFSWVLDLTILAVLAMLFLVLGGYWFSKIRM